MVILGWSPILPILLGELCIAAESRGGAVFVLLTQLPKPELEDWLQDQGVDFKNSTVVVRSGQENCKETLSKWLCNQHQRLSFSLDQDCLGRMRTPGASTCWYHFAI